MLVTPDELGFYYLGGKIKLQLSDNRIIEDYLDDCRLVESYAQTYYLLSLRKHGNFQVGAKTMFEWSAE